MSDHVAPVTAIRWSPPLLIAAVACGRRDSIIHAIIQYHSIIQDSHVVLLPARFATVPQLVGYKTR